MNYEGVKAVLLWYFTNSGAGDEVRASTIYTDDALVEFPQSGERFRGKANFVAWRSAYPASTLEFELRSLRGSEDTWVLEGRVSYDSGEPMPYLGVFHFRGELVDRETLYVFEGFPADTARAAYAEQSPLDSTLGLPLRVRADGGGVTTTEGGFD